MFTFFCRIIILFTLAFSFLTSPKVSALPQENYLEGLFKEVEAREKNPETQPTRIYDTLIKNSLSFKLLDKYPKLMIGKIRFSPHVPKDLEGREADIQKGQDLILKVLLTPAMLNDSVTFKDLIQQIDLSFQNSQNSLRYPDWIIIASAFRTLSAPNSEATHNALGIFVTEYIILMLIDDLEKKSNHTKEENELLSTLYYILSQIYQNIINNPDEYHFIKKKEKKSSPLYLSLPKIYYEDSYYEDTYIEPITRSIISEYDIPYDDPYFYSIFISFDVTYDILVIQRLYLLRTAVIVTPYYDAAWVPIIRYIAVDLRSPFYVERLTPVFWNNYFPLGIVGVEPIYIDKIYSRWEKITVNDPRAISQIQNPKAIANSLRELRNPEWRKKQEKKVEQQFQEKLKESQLEEGKKEHSLQERQERLRHEERREERRLQKERQEQLPLERKQERLRHEERREEQHLQQERQEQLPLERKQERLRHEERREERRLQKERQEQLPLERKQERLRREERREEQHLQQERQEQLPLERGQEQIRREESQKKQIIEQKIEGLKSEEKRETPRPMQEMKIPHMEPQKPTIERQGPSPSPQEGPKPGNPKKSK